MELFIITLMENERPQFTYSSSAHTEHLPSVSTLEVGEVGGKGEQILLCGVNTAPTDGKKNNMTSQEWDLL